MAASTSAPFQLYLRIAEAKGLKGVEKNSSLDAFVKIVIDGQKANLETKVGKSTSPVWQQEFVVSVPQANSTVELKIYERKLLQSNTLLGTARLNLEQYKTRVFEAAWLNLDTQGQLSVMLLLEPYSNPLDKPVRERLSQMRVQLENSAYYPGSILRGVAVYATVKPVSIHGLSLTLDGHSYVYWSRGSNKNRTLYYSYRNFFNERVALLGGIGVDAKLSHVDLVPGVYLFPFEYVLPMDLPPSFGGNWTYCIKYHALLHCWIKGKKNKAADLSFRVLANHKLMRSELIGAEVLGVKGGVLSKDEHINLHIHGPATALVNEPYKLFCKIDNLKGTKAVESMTVVLRKKEWGYGRMNGCGFMVQRSMGKKQIKEWKLTDLPHLPIAPGTVWEGDVEIQMPGGLMTSIHSTMCPNIQYCYYLKLKVATSGNVFFKASGSSCFNILIATNNNQFRNLSCPAEPLGPLKQVWIAPAPPHVFAMLPPAVMRNGSIVHCGRPIGSVGLMPGACIATSVPDPYPPCGTTMCMITNDQWTPGTSPEWVGKKGAQAESLI